MRKTLLLTLILLLAGACFAQSDTATVSGRVTDSSGAIIRNAKVVMTNVATNVTATTRTDKDGFYVFTGVRPAHYRIAAGADGFSVLVKSDLVLHVQDEVSENFTLKVGSASETVTVAADAVRVNTSPAVATTIDSNFVAHMPLNGRTIQSLLALTPGVLTVTPGGSSNGLGNFSGNEGQISVNGQRETSNYMTIDGVSANIGTSVSDISLGAANGLLPGFGLLGTTTSMVSVDDLQEFKVQTSNYSAEFGRQPGGQIQLTTKSGTNQWHGSAYEYLRNDFMDARNWFLPAKSKTPALRFNDFGATLGGPLWKDHTFFFFSYEGDRVILPQYTITSTASRQLRQVAAPILQPFLSTFAQPTGPDDANGLSAPWAGSYSNPQNQDAESLRIDHNLNNKIRLFTRFNYSPQDSRNLQPWVGQTNINHALTRTWTAGADVTFTPSLVNQFRFNWSTSYAANRTGFSPGVKPPDSSALAPSPLTSSALVDVYFYYAGGPVFNDVGKNMGRSQVNLTDTLSKLWGNHLLKFGVDYNGSSATNRGLTGQLTYSFSSLAGAQSATAFSAYYTYFHVSQASYSYHDLGAFAQDTWRVTPRLTLDYGVRWDVNPPPSFSPKAYFAKLDWQNPAVLAPLGTPVAPTIWTAFAPRFGVSYLLSNREGRQLVLRGGYGLFWDPGSIPPTAGPYFPNTYSTSFRNVSFPLASSLVSVPPPNLTPPYGGAGFAGNFQVIADSGYRLPRVHQWNIALEQALGSNQKVSVTYVGNAGRALTRETPLSPISSAYPIASPDFGPQTSLWMFSTSPGHSDYSNYSALQVQYNRRGKHVNAIVSYTWSHSLDTNAGLLNTSTLNWLKYSPSQDYASSDFDRRQLFSAALNWYLPAVPGGEGFGKVAHAVTNGWELDTMLQYQSAAPFTALYYNYISLPLTGNYNFLRPDLNSSVPLWISDSSVAAGRRLNPAAFTLPATATQGSEPRNAIRGFGLFQPDLAIGRTFAVGERFHIQLRGEAFNFLNHPNFAPPDNFYGFRLSPTFMAHHSTFGQSIQTVNNGVASVSPLFETGGPRDLQVSLRLSF